MFGLYQALHDQALGRQVGDPTTEIIETHFSDPDALGVTRQRPVLLVAGFNQLIETVKDFQILMPRRRRFQRVGAQPKQTDHDQSRQAVQGSATFRTLSHHLLAQFLEQIFKTANLTGLFRPKMRQRDTRRRQLRSRRRQVGVYIDQLPHPC
ncbi:hypothetical protein D3C72_1216020 [compost metagenome]